MLKRCRQSFILVLLGLGCCASTPVFSGNLDWKNPAASSSSALTNSRNYVNRHRNNLDSIYNYADSLLREGRLVEVLHVYETALIYHPDNPVLLRKIILVQSDLRENDLLVASQNRQSQTVTPSVAHALEQIKCRTLRGKKGVNACLRLQQSNSKNLSQLSQIRSEVISKPVQEVSHHEYSFTKSQPTTTSPVRIALRGIDIGNFHALVIGNNRYRHFPKLETAVQDAKVVASILKNDYGYQVTQLRNASRYKVFQELSRLRRQLKENDNLLIYYAGHGYLDENTKRGYWLPVDAEADNYANWLSTSDVTDMLNGMAAKHVLVVADSCYSGSLTRSIKISPQQLEPDQLAWIQRINTKKSRTVMTSGGLEPVLDSGNGEHSIFAEAFIHALNRNNSVLEAARMFTEVRRAVVLNADQTPEYADIRKAEHEGGDFIFARINPH